MSRPFYRVRGGRVGISGRAGVRKVRYQGEEHLWAYGKRAAGRPFPLISLPYQQVVAQAKKSEAYAQAQVLMTLKLSLLMLLAVAIVVSILAIFRSRTLTRPILILAGATKDLSAGNFAARVDIRTGARKPPTIPKTASDFDSCNTASAQDRATRPIITAKERVIGRNP